MSRSYKQWKNYKITNYVKYSICDFYKVLNEDFSMHCLKCEKKEGKLNALIWYKDVCRFLLCEV